MHEYDPKCRYESLIRTANMITKNYHITMPPGKHIENCQQHHTRTRPHERSMKTTYPHNRNRTAQYWLNTIPPEPFSREYHTTTHIPYHLAWYTDANRPKGPLWNQLDDNHQYQYTITLHPNNKIYYIQLYTNGKILSAPVSYTHLTLPTIYSV